MPAERTRRESAHSISPLVFPPVGKMTPAATWISSALPYRMIEWVKFREVDMLNPPFHFNLASDQIVHRTVPAIDGE